MNAQELLKAGNLSEAIISLQKQVRDDPASAKLRVFLFQLYSVVGDWKRALTQLNIAAEMDPKTVLMAHACRTALACESLRAEVFEGKRTPLVFGEPQPWVGWMIEAVQLDAQANTARAAELRTAALEAAPAVAGNANGQPFQWLADADSRIGPILEAIIEGRYFWIPMSSIQSFSTEKPTDLRDVVWLPANFTWSNGGTAVGMIPTRYPGTERSADDALRLARKTEWSAPTESTNIGVGQRTFATDYADVALFDARKIVFGEDEPSAPEVAHG